MSTKKYYIHFIDSINMIIKDGLPIECFTDEISIKDELILKESSILGKWEHFGASLKPQEINSYRYTAQNDLNISIGNFNLTFIYESADDNIITKLQNIYGIEYIQEISEPSVCSVSNFESQQHALFSSLGGYDVVNAWEDYGWFGEGVQVCDAELSYRGHSDIPVVEVVSGWARTSGDFESQHGLAEQGIVCAKRNGLGVSGIAPGIDASYFVGCDTGASVLLDLLPHLHSGDVVWMPWTYSEAPPERYTAWYDAIQTLTGNGIIVIQSAGNGNIDLDSYVYANWTADFRPFTTMPSGAIYVGAAYKYDNNYYKHNFSNYGSRLDIFSIGSDVHALGASLSPVDYGNKSYNSTEYVITDFGGTSSAGGIIAGLCALIQSIYFNKTGNKLTPAQMKAKLKEFSTLPIDNTKIGVTPNLTAILSSLVSKTAYTRVTSVNMYNAEGYLSTMNMKMGDAQKWVRAEVNPPNAQNKNISWTNSNKSVVKVLEYEDATSPFIYITPLSIGTSVITLASVDGVKIQSLTVNVEAVVVDVVSISLDKTTVNLNVGNTSTLLATISPSDATNKTVTWSSSNNAIATVSSSGVITAIAAGTATITATSNNSKTAICTVTVTQQAIPVDSITLNQTTLSMVPGISTQLSTTIIPLNATDKSITWTTSDPTIATVNSTGVVIPIKAGTVTITATSNNGKAATCSIIIEEAHPASPTITVTSVRLDQDTRKVHLNLAASITSGDIVTVTYTKGTVKSASGVDLATFNDKPVTNKTGQAPVNQKWGGFPVSPVLSSQYPYQCITHLLSDRNDYLIASKYKLYDQPDGYISNIRHQLVVYIWMENEWVIYDSAAMLQQFTSILEANYDVYTDSTYGEVRFAKNI